MSSPKIPLFDVDWTLLRGGPSNIIHHEAFNFALHSIYNQPEAAFGQVKSEGSIDTRILIETLKIHGVPEEESKKQMPEALAAMAKYFKEHVNEGTYEPMPGVLDLLNGLKQRDAPVGLLTGNVRDIAYEKLTRAGIRDYFSFGAFGSMAFQRVDLIEVARQEASKILDREVQTQELVIVGDSPLDIACARAGGIPVIAVGAGHFKSRELTHADLTLESLEEKSKILQFLGLL